MTSRITFVDREQWYVIITFYLAWTPSARPPVPDTQLKSESWLSKLVVHSSISIFMRVSSYTLMYTFITFLILHIIYLISPFYSTLVVIVSFSLLSQHVYLISLSTRPTVLSFHCFKTNVYHFKVVNITTCLVDLTLLLSFQITLSYFSTLNVFPSHTPIRLDASLQRVMNVNDVVFLFYVSLEMRALIV